MWSSVLVKWVNCLDLQDTPIQEISELGDGKFFHRLLNVIYHKQKHGISTDETDEAVIKFLKCEYPLYLVESESFILEDDEIVYVTSLLMLHCVVASKNKKIMECMYKLDEDTQVYIKNFFEIIMQDDNSITRSSVKHAITECGSNKALKETRTGHSPESPLIGFSTPKRPPIMDVFQSPLAQKIKEISEQRAMIERLNNELEAEQAEKIMLQEELHQERDKTKKLTQQLIEKNDEMKMLHEEWLYSDSESNKKAECSNSCQEAMLKKEIKRLETYISSLHSELDMLLKVQDLLQQRVFKAEQQCQELSANSQQYEALCEKLKHDAVEKEHELAHTKELCSELQRHLQEMKQVHNISVEDDSYIMSPGCTFPENVGQAVIDLRLQEQQEENKILSEELNKIVMKEEVMEKQICDLRTRSETAEHEAAALRATNLELKRKVDEMGALQLELEECQLKQGCLSQELDVLSQKYAEERLAHENDVQNLTSELRNVEAIRDKLREEYSTSETKRSNMLALNVELEKKISSLNIKIATVQSSLLSHKEQQENLIVTLNKQIEEKEETILQLIRKGNVLQNEIDCLGNEKKDLYSQLHASNSGLSELQMCNEHLSQLLNNVKAENTALELTTVSQDRKIEELLHENSSIVEELEKVKASKLLLLESKLCLVEQHSKELREREEKINRLLKEEQFLNEEKKKADLMLLQMEELMCERETVSRLCKDLRNNVSGLQVAVAVQDQNVNGEREVGQNESITKTEHKAHMCNETEGCDTECFHIPNGSEKRSLVKPWSVDSVTGVSVHADKLSSNKNECADNSRLSENSSGLQSSYKLCAEVQGIPLEAESAATTISASELQTDHKEHFTNLSEVINVLKVLNAEHMSLRGEVIRIIKSNDILRNELSNTEDRCHDITQKYQDLTFRNDILNSENEKMLKDVEQLENFKSLMEINERALAAQHCLNAELNTEKEAIEESYKILKDDFQKIKRDNESLNIVIGTMKNETSSLHKRNLELSEKLQKCEMLHLKFEEKQRKLIRSREEREVGFNSLLNSEAALRQKMSEFQRRLKDVSYKFETIVLGTAASCNEVEIVDCQRIELEKLLTLLCTECEEIFHSIFNWTYKSLQEAEQNVENQYLGISVHLGVKDPPETVLNLDRDSESDVVDDTGGVNLKTRQQQEIDNLQLQITTLISVIEVALKKCASVDNRCNHILEMCNIKTESNTVLCDKDAFQDVRDLYHADRTNQIKDIVTKLLGSEEVVAELEDGWNPEHLLEMDSWAKSDLLTCEEKAVKGNKKKASEHSAVLNMRLKLEQSLCQKTEEVEFLNSHSKTLQAMLDEEQNVKAEVERKLNELKALHEALANEKEVACKLKSAEEDKCMQLQIELERVSGVKQEYETLLEINHKLQSENDDMKHQVEEGRKAIQHEYERKLDKIKAKMVVLYEEEVEKKTKQLKEKNGHLQERCRLYENKIGSYENNIDMLKSQVWEIGDKLLLTKREKKKLEEEFSKQKASLQSTGKEDDLGRYEILSNLERGRKITGSSRDVRTLDIIDESITVVRRKTSIPRALPSGMGAFFDPEDEEGEVFNTTNLADLKAGRCLPQGYKGRISELQYRNSLCPPHLKSSYPAETQFHHPQEYSDEDLKLGCAVEVDQFDTLSTSMLLPSDKQRKKDRGQTSYKKPGPPTPGKNGGRLSLQGTEVVTPRAPLRESNDGACVRKASTPSRLKLLFMSKNRRDENAPVTPRGRRLSSIFRGQVKNRQN